jgi:hypothetical protein
MIGHQAAEARAIPRNEPVGAVEEARGDTREERCERSRQAERSNEIDESGAVADEASVWVREAPARVALLLVQHGEEKRRSFVGESEEGELASAIERGDDTRHPAAEASVVVVDEDGPDKLVRQGRYAAAGLPAGVKKPRTSSVLEPVFSTMWT